MTAGAIVTDGDDVANVDAVHGGMIKHCDDAALEKLFLPAFECGGELFETRFNAVDGVGAYVGDGGRFTRLPRADQNGPGEWADHFPARATGPNSAACNVCHNQPFDDGAGEAASNVVRDPFHKSNPRKFIQRNTPHVFGSGALQVLAEEMNEELRAVVDGAIVEACPGDGAERRMTKDLVAKGVEFGSVEVIARWGGPCPQRINLNVEGIDQDLVVKPLQWKGSEPTVRSFNRGASHNELGMQPVEITGDGVDGDGDGVVDEMSIADQTALAVHVAAQPRPVTRVDLNALRDLLEDLGPEGAAAADELGLPALSEAELAAIANGEAVFSAIGCADCHRPALVIDEPIFHEPSQNPNYRDDRFPAGQPGLDPTDPIAFDLTADQPDNVIEVGGAEVAHLGPFETDGNGGAIVRLFGDLKRHDMGAGLAENIDEVGTGASVWMTKELWGVGSTGQYLHDGRATTIKEAILEHGGEAQASRDNFSALSLADEVDLIAFLENLVLFKLEDK